MLAMMNISPDSHFVIEFLIYKHLFHNPIYVIHGLLVFFFVKVKFPTREIY